MNLKILDKNAHWWRKQKVDWAVQDKEGAWWIIPGSEFPEKKINEDMRIRNNNNERDNGTDLKFLFFVMLSSFLGVSLAVALAYFLSK